MPADVDAEIAAVNRQILERRVERGSAATAPLTTSEGKQPDVGRPAADLSGLTSNDFRAGMPVLPDADIADWIATYRAGYQRYADSPEILELMEARLREALAKDGHKLAPMPAEARLKLLRSRHV